MKQILIFILSILIMCLLSACKNSENPQALGSGNVFFTIYDITAPADGKILGLILEKGDRIGKGQPLFAVSDQQLDEEIKQAAADAALAEAALKAMRSSDDKPDNTAGIAAAQQQYEQAAAQEAKMAALYKQGAVARRQYEAASAAKASAEAMLAEVRSGSRASASPEEIASKEAELKELQKKYNALLQKQLALEAESPCTGIVAEKYINTNEIASAGQKVLSIRDLENCNVIIKTGGQTAGISPGQKVTAHAGSINKTFNGTIISTENGSITVSLDNSSLDLREGMEVSIAAAK